MKKIMVSVLAMVAMAGYVFAGLSAVDNPQAQRYAKTVSIQAQTLSITYGGSGTNSVGSIKLYDFPEGVIHVVGVVVDDLVCDVVATNGFADTDDGDFGLGTSAIAAASTLGTAAEVNLAPKTAFDNIGSTTNDAVLAADMTFDGSSTAADMYLNVLVDADAMTGSASGTVSARIHIIYEVVGDN